MGRKRVVKINEQERKALVEGLRKSDNFGFRQRCELVLLKSECRSSKEVACILKVTTVTVRHWLNRYEKEGIDGLRIKAGRGRKPILDPDLDSNTVRKAVQEERQRLKQAKLIVEQESGKQFSLKTLRRFLKALTVATEE